MHLKKIVPRQPDPFIKKAADQEIAKFGHLNYLLGLIENIAPGGVASVNNGTGITVDNTDPANPIINFTGGLSTVLGVSDDAGQLNITNLYGLYLANDGLSSSEITDSSSRIEFDTAGTAMNLTGGTVTATTLLGGGMLLNGGAATLHGLTVAISVNSGPGDLDFNTFAGNADFTGITGDVLLADWTFDKGVGLLPLVDATMTLGDGTFNLSAVHTNAVTSNTGLTLRTANNGDMNLIVNGTGIMNMNGAATYTGTVAGAAALNVVNGLIMA